MIEQIVLEARGPGECSDCGDQIEMSVTDRQWCRVVCPNCGDVCCLPCIHHNHRIDLSSWRAPKDDQ